MTGRLLRSVETPARISAPDGVHVEAVAGGKQHPGTHVLTPDYPPEFAADGIDELITGFGQRRKYQPQAGLAADGEDDGGLLRVVTTDTGDAWSIEIRPAASSRAAKREPMWQKAPDSRISPDAR